MAISKTWKKAGSLPGQYQKVTFTFKSRNVNKVVASWKLYARSLGYDNYSYSTRHNKAVFGSKAGSSIVSEDSKTYQLKGTHAKNTFSDSFTITGVKDASTSIPMYYKNARWTNGQYSWDPATTGVVKSWTKVGNLPVKANEIFSVDFDPVTETAENVPEPLEVYKGKKYTVPSNTLTSDTFTFNGWSTTQYTPGSGSVDRVCGEQYTTSADITLYAVWTAKPCYYIFYDGSTQVKKIEHVYGTLDSCPEAPTKSGYIFTGWKSRQSEATYSANGNILDEYEWPIEGNTTYFDAQWVADTYNITFYYCADGYSSRSYTLSSGDSFNFSRPLSDIGQSELSIKPGYKLLGWVTSPSDPVSDDSGSYIPLSYSGVPSNTRYYALYQYYTTSYVYTNNEWRLALPYVYTNNGWRMATSYVYNNNSWKL